MKVIRLLFLFLITLVVITSCKEKLPSFEAPLLKNIGNYQVPVTTRSAYAQLFFNQGIIMANGFNHAEAERSFREAVRLDSTFAMGYWGIAYVLGPNYNSSSNMGAINEIKQAVSNAIKFSDHSLPWEKAAINAIQIKFPIDTLIIDAEGYSNSMKEAVKQFPENAFVATLYAESVMNLHPWDFYVSKGGEPRPWTSEIVTLLEKVISIDPENPLANHLYLHAAEAGPNIEKALPSADRLKTLVPAAGHLVHMPSHIYINTGDYHAGSVANEKAVIADSIYIAECKVQGYYPQLYYTHNYHFLAATATFEGRGARAIEAAYKTADLVDKKYYHEAGYETTQHYLTIPLHVLVKFAQWEKIIASPKPSDDLLYPAAIWHYARGMAFSNLGKIAEAKEELEKLNEIAKTDAVASIIIWGLNPATEICTLSSLVLKSEIISKEGKNKEAIQLLNEAIAIEDGLNYNEPPDWFFSVRHSLGNIQLLSGDFVAAEKTYRDDLMNWPKNGFALNGLIACLKGQGKESNQIEQQFKEAWKLADSNLKGSLIDSDKRKELTLRIDQNSPDNLVYIASSICVARRF